MGFVLGMFRGIFRSMKCSRLYLVFSFAVIFSFGGVGLAHAANYLFEPSVGDSQLRNEFEYTVLPGETLNEVLTIERRAKRGDPVSVSVDLYAVDAQMTENGFLAMVPELEEQKYFGKWVELKIPSLEFSDKVNAPFSISIPGNVTPGQYVGGFALIERNKLAVTDGDRKLSAVDIRMRYATAVYLTVVGDEKPSYGISGEKISIHGDIFDVQFTLEYMGNTVYELSGDISLKGIFQNEHVDIWSRKVIPGASVTVKQSLRRNNFVMGKKAAYINLVLNTTIAGDKKKEEYRNVLEKYDFPLLSIILFIGLFSIVFLILFKYRLSFLSSKLKKYQ